jgi:restriction endonuclease S subunit
MQTQLKTLADIQFGYYAQPSNLGKIPYLQGKNFSAIGQFLDQVDTFIEDSPKVKDFALQDGDILFTSKGFKVFAAVVEGKLVNTIASSLFYVIKVDLTKIHPQYLVAVLNTQKSIQHFRQLGAGSSIPSIRKSEVLDFTFNLISLDQQQKIIELNKLFLKDLEINQNLLQQKHILYNETISQLIK